VSIFATPQKDQNNNQFGVKILFLHGLEGSPTGEKSQHLKKTWGALSPRIRTSGLVELKSKCSGQWDSLEYDEIYEAMGPSYSDAIDAVTYMKPDIVIGSSLGAALLYRMMAEGEYEGSALFLAPAISALLSPETIKEGKKILRESTSVWLLGETDQIVSNSDNISIAKSCNGNVMMSPSDGHRLQNAVASGLLDAALLTVIEIFFR